MATPNGGDDFLKQLSRNFPPTNTRPTRPTMSTPTPVRPPQPQQSQGKPEFPHRQQPPTPTAMPLTGILGSQEPTLNERLYPTGGLPEEHQLVKTHNPTRQYPQPVRSRYKTRKETHTRPKIVVIILVSIAVICAGSTIAMFSQLETLRTENTELEQSNTQLEQDKQTLQDQLDSKETFSTSMLSLLETLKSFTGTPYAEVVNSYDYQTYVNHAYEYRTNSAQVNALATEIDQINIKMTALKTSMETEKTSNSTGQDVEDIIDKLSAGYVTTSFDSTVYCGTTSSSSYSIVACANGTNNSDPSFDGTKTIAFKNGYTLGLQQYTGDEEKYFKYEIAYHEFAHILQLANPEATEEVLALFSGVESSGALDSTGGSQEYEYMADCFAYTYSPYPILENVGYGYKCSTSEQEAIKTWYETITYKVPTYTAE